MYLIFAGERYYPLGATNYVETCMDLDVAKAKAVELLGKTVPSRYREEAELDWVEILELPSGTVHDYKGGTWTAIPQTQD